jgi:hypothetical protein
MVACLFFLAIPMLFSIKKYFYKRKAYKESKYENPLFLAICFFFLYALGFYGSMEWCFWASWPFLTYVISPIFVYLLEKKKAKKQFPIIGKKP